MSTKLRWIAKMANEEKEMRFTNIAYLLRPDFLHECFLKLKKKAAPGIDGVDFGEYFESAPRRIEDLHQRLKGNRYRAPAVKRVYIEKDGGGKRPLGLPTLEDKIVQKGASTILEAIYEQDFLPCSFGFRRKHNQHQALGTFREACTREKVEWVVDMDIKGYFDAIDHKQLMKLLEIRISDSNFLRLIGKWLKAGVLEDDVLRRTDEGTPQGGVVSPILANVYLHYVLDLWFEEQIKPVLKGRAAMVRFADDALIGFSSEADARRFMKVLPKRFTKFGLTIHPEKTKLVRFAHPWSHKDGDGENGTFDFLGFTHYWGKTQKGGWAIMKKTAAKKLRSKMTLIWDWCKLNRHKAIRWQHKTLQAKLRGHYQYYGVRGNWRSMSNYHYHTRCSWRYWLSRRNRKSPLTWEKFERLEDCGFDLPRPRIIHV